MAPSEFYIQVQQGGASAGFAGGTAPPPSAGHAITRSAQSKSLQIQSVSGGDQQSAEFTSSKEKLVDEIQGILKDLPTVTSGLDVIYDTDVGLFWGSDSGDLPAWKNKRQGEIGEGEREGSSWRRATDEENAKFKRVVELVDKLVNGQ